MNIVRLGPLAELDSVRDRFDRLFEDYQPGRRDGTLNQLWAPVVDIEDKTSEIAITMDLPGIKLDDIDIEMTGDVLTVKGERRAKVDETKPNYVRKERAYGAFQRSFTFGVPIQPDKISATYTDGVLHIVMPKAETMKPKKVKVQPQ